MNNNLGSSGRAVTEDLRPFGGGGKGHPDYEKNLDRVPYHDMTIACCHCGKHTKKPKFFACLADVAEYIRVEDYDDMRCDLGFYPVGSDCAKVLKKHGIPLYDFEGNPR